jgi:hypothetical protein
LVDIIKTCEKKYGLEVTNKNTKTYLHFLTRQVAAHPDYKIAKKDLPGQKSYRFFCLLVDKLLLFSYLVGETRIIAGYKDETGDHTHKQCINDVKDLYLLRQSEMGYYQDAMEADKRRTDPELFRLLGRIVVRKCKFGFPGWRESIDELGNDPTVKRHFGQKIAYEMVVRCRSPNPLTFAHGGYKGRRVKK